MSILRILRRAAALSVVAAAGLSWPAQAGHTIYPGTYASHLNPSLSVAGGTPSTGNLTYDSYASPCSGDKGGLTDLVKYLKYWWGNRNAGTYRCDPPSIHSNGRAVDYFLDKNNATQKAQGDAIFGFWRKTDSWGATYSAMKRFGVQTVIWNCKIYSASNLTIRTYFRCNPSDPGYSTSPTLRHEDHVHIDITIAAGNRNRTAWTGYRPCPTGHGGCPQAAMTLAQGVRAPEPIDTALTAQMERNAH